MDFLELPVGSLIATVRANDIDLASKVTYSIRDDGNGHSDKVSLTTFTGQMYLLKKPDDWETNEISIRIDAFDGIYTATEDIVIYVDKPGKDCRPRFDSPLYKMEVASNSTYPIAIGEVAASACGTDEHIIYSVKEDHSSSSVVSILNNGTVVLNQAMATNTSTFILEASDRRSKKTTSSVMVIEVKAVLDAPLEFDITSDTIEVGADLQVLKLRLKNDNDDDDIIFNVTKNERIAVDSVKGIMYKKTDQAFKSPITLDVSARRASQRPGEAVSKSLRFFWSADLQQGVNTFRQSSREVTLSTASPVNTKVNLCKFDEASTINQILSGNEDNLFALDAAKQVLVLVKQPAAVVASKKSEVKIVIRSGSSRNDLAVCSLHITFTDANAEVLRLADQDEQDQGAFVLDDLVTSVRESLPSGTFVLQPPLKRSATGSRRFTFWTESSLFNVNPTSGYVMTKSILDYETTTTHLMQIFANDTKSGRQYVCNVQVLVESADDFAPVFVQDVYTFNIPSNAQAGDRIGTVRARDQDSGPDGYVTYAINPHSSYFNIDQRTGSLSIRRPLDTGVLDESGSNLVRRKKRSLRELNLKITAKSRKSDSLSATADVVMYLDDERLPVAASTQSGGTGTIIGVLVGVLLVIFIICGFMYVYCKNFKEKQAQKIALLPTSHGGAASVDQSLEMVGRQGGPMGGGRYPPQYSEIMSDYERATTATSSTPAKANLTRSEISEKSHRSASSGRGSVEDGDEDADVEIRMINEGGGGGGSAWTPGAAMGTGSAVNHGYEADQVSEAGSVQNTEEYLARLGIDIRKPPNMKLEDHYSAGGSIYNRIADDAMSERASVKQSASLIYGSTGRQLSMTGSLSSIVHSEEELAGSYNWDYLLDWCPQYQNLAHVFKEISKLKDDDDGNDPGGGGGSGIPPPPAGLIPSSSRGAFGLKNPAMNRLVPVRTAQSPIVAQQDLLTQNALSPNFHPSLSPLATKSPSVSPMSVPLKSRPPLGGAGGHLI